jgi:hypothetical protein
MPPAHLLRRHFPQASLHAFTATATPRVREDIRAQLELREPEVLVGLFDRSNLVYRVLPQLDLRAQVLEVVRRHAGEAVIVYCLARKDTEAMAAYLASHQVAAAAYHAGLEAEERRRVQDAFAASGSRWSSRRSPSAWASIAKRTLRRMRRCPSPSSTISRKRVGRDATASRRSACFLFGRRRYPLAR